MSAATLALAGVDVPEWMDGRDMLAESFKGRDIVFAARDRLGSTLDRVRSARTERYKYIRNFHPDRPYSQHSGYKVLQYPGITAARVLHRRGTLTGSPAIFWSEKRPAEELYDLQADPEELNNLAENPPHVQTLIRLRNELDAWIKRTHDQGRFAEADEPAAVDSSNRWFRGRMKKRGLSPNVDAKTYLRWWEQELGLR